MATSAKPPVRRPTGRQRPDCTTGTARRPFGALRDPQSAVQSRAPATTPNTNDAAISTDATPTSRYRAPRFRSGSRIVPSTARTAPRKAPDNHRDAGAELATKGNLANLHAETKADLAELRTDLYRASWIQAAALIGTQLATAGFVVHLLSQ